MKRLTVAAIYLFIAGICFEIIAGFFTVVAASHDENSNRQSHYRSMVQNFVGLGMYTSGAAFPLLAYIDIRCQLNDGSKGYSTLRILSVVAFVFAMMDSLTLIVYV